MNAMVSSVRQNPLRAGLVGIALGVVLWLSIAFAIFAVGNRGPAASGTGASAAQATDMFQALRQHRIREYGVMSAAGPSQIATFEQLRRHSIREYGIASAAAPQASSTIGDQLRRHVLRENALGSAVAPQASATFAQLYQHSLRENAGR